MSTAIAQIKNDTITLPSSFRKRWKMAEVYIQGVGDTLVIKKLSSPTLSLKAMMRELQQAVKVTKLSKRQTTNIVREVRGQMYR